MPLFVWVLNHRMLMSIHLASFPCLHAQLLSLAAAVLQATKAGCGGLGTRLHTLANIIGVINPAG